jgi:hypothetical protein
MGLDYALRNSGRAGVGGLVDSVDLVDGSGGCGLSHLPVWCVGNNIDFWGLACGQLSS